VLVGNYIWKNNSQTELLFPAQSQV